MSSPKWSDDLLGELARHFPAVDACPDDELFALWAAASRQLQTRNLVRSLGNVPADLAERIVAQWAPGERTQGSTKAVDVKGKGGRRYQVKSLRRTDPGRNSVATISSFEFDELVVIVFEYDLSICLGLRVATSDLERHRAELLTAPDHRRLTLTPGFCSHSVVHQIPTAELAAHHPAPAIADWSPPPWRPANWE